MCPAKRGVVSQYAHTQHYNDQLVPGLKLFGAQRMRDVFYRVAQTVGVVVGRVDAPVAIEHTVTNAYAHHTHT